MKSLGALFIHVEISVSTSVPGLADDEGIDE